MVWLASLWVQQKMSCVLGQKKLGTFSPRRLFFRSLQKTQHPFVFGPTDDAEKNGKIAASDFFWASRGSEKKVDRVTNRKKKFGPRLFRKNFDGMKINSIISWLRSDENLTHLPTRQLSLIRFRWKICMSPVFVFQTLKWIRTGDCLVGSGDVLRTSTDSSFRWCKLLAYLENQ